MKTAHSAPELFKHPMMQLLAKTNRTITISYIVFYSIVLFLIHQKLNLDVSVFTSVYLFLGGLFSWTFFEYVLHRYIFHMAGESKAIKRFAYVMHGIHHDHPRVENFIFMPPVPGTMYILIFLAFFSLLLGRFSFIILSGFLIGYLIYANIHYYIHLSRPVKRFSFFWRHHSLHHYKYPNKAFGVSSPLWDIVFGTMPPRKHRQDVN